MEKILLGRADLTEANRIKSRLLESDVIIELIHNKETCNLGCSITVEIWGDKKDIAKIDTFFREEREKLLDGFDINNSHAEEIFDPEQKEATCPACGTLFETTISECPECGLVFSIE